MSLCAHTQACIVEISPVIMAMKGYAIVINIISHDLKVLASIEPETNCSSEGAGLMSFLHRSELGFYPGARQHQQFKLHEAEN